MAEGGNKEVAKEGGNAGVGIIGGGTIARPSFEHIRPAILATRRSSPSSAQRAFARKAAGREFG